MKKKAQLSFETIIIYGLIIVVVTLAVGALVYFGVLDLGKLLPEKCNTGAPTVCETYQIKSDATDGEIKLEIRNKVGKRLQFSEDAVISGSDDWIGTNCDLKTVNGNGTITDGLFDPVIGLDTTAVIAFECSGALEGAEEQRFKGTVTLEYQTVGSSLAQRTTGQLFAAISLS